MIKLEIKDGLSINIPITSLQSNALLVEHNHNQKHKEFLSSSKQNEVTRKRIKVDTGLLHDRSLRPDGVFATIRAHDLWRDVDIIQSIGPLCTTCKIMSILAHARSKAR